MLFSRPRRSSHSGFRRRLTSRCRTASADNRSASIHNQHEVGFVKPLVLSFSTSRYGEPTTFGDFIKKSRLEKGLKQAEVARVVRVDEMKIIRAGVRTDTLSRPNNASRPEPRSSLHSQRCLRAVLGGHPSAARASAPRQTCRFRSSPPRPCL